MEKVLEKLEAMAERIFKQVEEQPIKTILYAVLIYWIIGKAIKNLRRD